MVTEPQILLSMQDRGSQEMSVAPDQLLLDGKPLLPESIHSGNNQTDQISHYGYPFPIHPNLAAEFIVPILPDLNSLLETTPSTSMAEAMCPPSTPMNLDKNKRTQDREPREVIGIVDVSETDEIVQRKEISDLQPSAQGQFLSEPAVPSQVVPSRPHEGQMDAARSPNEFTLQQSEVEEDGRREDQVIDLDKTPQQKPRRKKHRPKVVREGKPSRTPKPVTPKPVTPNPARNQESTSNKRKYVRKKKVPDSSDTPSCPSSDIVDSESVPSPSGKRKYVRKKKDLKSSDTPSCPPVETVDPNNGTVPHGKRKYVRKKKDLNSLDTPASPSSDTIDPKSQSGTKSVRRCLNFESEEVQARDGRPTSSLKFTSNEEVRVQDSCFSDTVSRSSIELAAPTAQAWEVVVEKSEADTCNLRSSANQIMNEYTRIPVIPSPPSRPFRLTMATLHSLKVDIRAEKNPTTPPHSSRREIIRENLKELASKNDYLKIYGNSDSDISVQTSWKSESDSNNTSDALSRGIKRDHMLIGEDGALPHTSFMHAHRGVDHISEIHDPFFPEVHKKKRTRRQKELSPNASSSLISSPSSGCKTSLAMSNNSEVFTSAVARRPRTSRKTNMVVQNNYEVFTFSDAQRFMDLQRQKSSEFMLKFDLKHPKTKKVSYVPLPAGNVDNLVASKDWKTLWHSVNPSRYSIMGISQISPPEKEQINLGNPVSLSANNTRIDKYPHLRVSSNQDCQGGRTFKKLANFRDKNLYPRGISLASAVVPYRDPLDYIIRKLSRLNINGRQKKLRVEAHNALIQYGGVGTIVPYGGPFDFIKRRRPRPKVELDPETNRVWNVLMGKETTDERVDMDKEKWWEEERRIVRGRVDSFIARMHLVQGDRRFSQWKGSVVDSVVGVFLTQNVSDHLSSSAFMALAARFPPRPTGNNDDRPNVENNCSFTEQQQGSMIAFDHSMTWKEKMLAPELCPRIIPEAMTHMEERKTSNSNVTLESITHGSNFDHQKEGIASVGHQREIGISSESPECLIGIPVTATGSTSVSEAEDRRSTEDIFSSQNSVASSQNSSMQKVETSDHIRLSSLSNFDMEDFDSSTSFMDLLKMTESTKFQELYSHGNGRVPPTSLLDPFDHLKGKFTSIYRSNSQLSDIDQELTGVSCAPLSFFNHNPLNSQATAMGNVNAIREDTTSNLPTTVSRTKVMKDMQIMNGESSTEASSPSSHLYSSYSRLMATISGNAVREECSSPLDSTASRRDSANNIKTNGRCGSSAENWTEYLSCTHSPSSHIHDSLNSKLTGMGDENAERKQISSNLSPTSSGVKPINKNRIMGSGCGLSDQILGQKILSFTSKTAHALETFSSITEQSLRPLTCSETEARTDLQKERTETTSGNNVPEISSSLQDEQTTKFHPTERAAEFQAKITECSVNLKIDQTCLNSSNNLNKTVKALETAEPNLKVKADSSQTSTATPNNASNRRKVKIERKAYNWDNLRKQACQSGSRSGRCRDTVDSLDWEAVRRADVNEIAHTIRERGMNNMLAERIKDFLDRLVKDHGSIDLEWLRDVPPDAAKDYLLSIRGLGLKSVECVRLLTLHHLAFPVDTNVGRICVRLGWVPLQPLPESLQLHLLELYPILETIQKHLWPRLCKLDQRTLYELHYQMITFGKVFCTKSKPNCNACPMRAECRHFASAFASARLALPGPEEKGLVKSTIPIHSEPPNTPVLNPMSLPQLEGSTFPLGPAIKNCEPIIEEPASPEPESIEALERDIEDAFYEDPDEIPIINLNLEEFTHNVKNYMQENMELQDGDMSKALIAITQEAASIPVPKLKNVSRLRTEHQVYELPDTHPLLDGMDQREPDDPCSYLLAIWTPGETAQSIEPPKACCDSQDTGKLCDHKTCFACNSIREAQAHTVRGTILIPCRTAMKGSFPLNGTYFQVNEVFADHDSSCNPIDVSRQLIWNLPRRTVYFGTSIPTIFKGLTTEGIQHCFWRGFLCVRGFDRTTRAPRPLYARLHFPASKALRDKKIAAAKAEVEAKTLSAVATADAVASAASTSKTAAATEAKEAE